MLGIRVQADGAKHCDVACARYHHPSCQPVQHGHTHKALKAKAQPRQCFEEHRPEEAPASKSTAVPLSPANLVSAAQRLFVARSVQGTAMSSVSWIAATHSTCICAMARTMRHGGQTWDRSKQAKREHRILTISPIVAELFTSPTPPFLLNNTC